MIVYSEPIKLTQALKFPSNRMRMNARLAVLKKKDVKTFHWQYLVTFWNADRTGALGQAWEEANQFQPYILSFEVTESNITLGGNRSQALKSVNSYHLKRLTKLQNY